MGTVSRRQWEGAEVHLATWVGGVSVTPRRRHSNLMLISNNGGHQVPDWKASLSNSERLDYKKDNSWHWLKKKKHLFILFGCVGSQLWHRVVVAFCGIFCFDTQTLWLQHVGSKMHGSAVVAHEPSCSMTCWILVPQPGFKLMSPTLQGGFSTTGLPGNSLIVDT